MADTEGNVTESIREAIALGQHVYDYDGKRVGTVDEIDHETGYFQVRTNPLAVRDLYVPFRLITNADARELYLSMSREELHQAYGDPPQRVTVVSNEDGSEVATTTELSGYTNDPIVVTRVEADAEVKGDS